MLKLESKSLEEFIGFELIDLKMKKRLETDKKLNKEITEFLSKNVGVPHLIAVQKCNVEYIDYEGIELEDLDVEESQEMIAKMKKNLRICPSHRMCPVFLSNNISKGESCILELLDAQYMIEGFVKELEIDFATDFNDQILLGQLVGLHVLNNRAMRILSSGPLIEEVKTISKGEIKIDTKINEAYTLVERSTNLMRKLKEDLILNRKDKHIYKKIKAGKTMQEASEKVSNQIKAAESGFDMHTLMEAEIVTNENQIRNIGDI